MLRALSLCGAVLGWAVSAGQADAAPVVATVVAASSSYSDGTETFPASNVVDGRTGDTGSPGDWSFWLTSNGDNNGYVTLDLGASYDITSFVVEDTHNRGYFDRGTQGFTISVGDLITPTTVAVTGAFTVAQWQNLDDVTFTTAATGRYVRFDVTSCYGCGSVGLNELSVFGTATAAVPEPGSLALLAAGVIGIAAARRRPAA